jgi:hypothetical protein
LDPEARPASRDLPFELESYEECMASSDPTALPVPP